MTHDSTRFDVRDSRDRSMQQNLRIIDQSASVSSFEVKKSFISYRVVTYLSLPFLIITRINTSIIMLSPQLVSLSLFALLTLNFVAPTSAGIVDEILGGNNEYCQANGSILLEDFASPQHKWIQMNDPGA